MFICETGDDEPSEGRAHESSSTQEIRRTHPLHARHAAAHHPSAAFLPWWGRGWLGRQDLRHLGDTVPGAELLLWHKQPGDQRRQASADWPCRGSEAARARTDGGLLVRDVVNEPVRALALWRVRIVHNQREGLRPCPGALRSAAPRAAERVGGRQAAGALGLTVGDVVELQRGRDVVVIFEVLGGDRLAIVERGAPQLERAGRGQQRGRAEEKKAKRGGEGHLGGVAGVLRGAPLACC